MKNVPMQLINQLFQKQSHVRIGKQGLSDGVLKEIAYQLDQLELIKIKVLVDTRDEFIELLQEIEKKQLGKVLSSRGRTFICSQGSKYKSFL